MKFTMVSTTVVIMARGNGGIFLISNMFPVFEENFSLTPPILGAKMLYRMALMAENIKEHIRTRMGTPMTMIIIPIIPRALKPSNPVAAVALMFVALAAWAQMPAEKQQELAAEGRTEWGRENHDGPVFAVVTEPKVAGDAGRDTATMQYDDGVMNALPTVFGAIHGNRFSLGTASQALGAITLNNIQFYFMEDSLTDTGIFIQPADPLNAASYTATFSLGPSGSVTEYVLTGTIPAGQYVTLYKLYAALPAGSTWLGSGFPAAFSTSSTSAERFGSVTIVADRSVVAAVTEADGDPVSGNRQDIKSYEAFNLAP